MPCIRPGNTLRSFESIIPGPQCTDKQTRFDLHYPPDVSLVLPSNLQRSIAGILTPTIAFQQDFITPTIGTYLDVGMTLKATRENSTRMSQRVAKDIQEQ